jgi:ubiquinone/menaquinone biosynthesis C-methylase UbiE
MTDPVEYDAIAPAYDRRYALHEYGGVEDAVRRFASAASAPEVLEVGCGTGHWLAALAPHVRSAAGLDPSAGMLSRARAAVPGAMLVRGRASALPWPAASFDRVLAVNALHHFGGPDAFVAEARRVLRPGGGVLVVGLDPHVGVDRWWIYEHFPSALAADRARYPATARLRELLASAGFVNAETTVAQHRPVSLTIAEADARGLLARDSTSQLAVIGTAEYETGVARLRALRAEPGAPEVTLSADLRVYATTAWLPDDARTTDA